MNTDNGQLTPKIIKGHCPKCGPDRLSDVKGEHKREESDEYDGWITYYRILVCRGCESAFFQSEELISELNIEAKRNPYQLFATKYYPSPIERDKPKWLSNFEGERLLAEFGIEKRGELWQLLEDVYGCLNANLAIPAAIAIRTTFDKAIEILGIEADSFREKLDALLENEKISQDEYDELEVLVDAGSAAVHRGWKPKPTELETLVSLIEAFLHRTFVLREAARQLKASVPVRPPRRPKGGNA